MRRSLWLVLFALGCEGTIHTATAGNGGSAGGGTGGTAGAGGSAGNGGTAGAAGAAGAGGSCGDCGGFSCCDGACVNLDNDVVNCGGCDVTCAASNFAYCDHGTCGPTPCDPSTVCAGTTTCCGTTCCPLGQLCCSVPGPVGEQLGCFDPVDGTCPKGCVLCQCTAEGTLVATPDGERPIETLAVGDWIYAEVDGAIAASPVALVARKPVEHHSMVRAVLSTGAELLMSAEHPIDASVRMRDLRPGSELHGAVVVRGGVEPYRGAFTYDLLPARGTGRWVAAGVLVGSTLR